MEWKLYSWEPARTAPENEELWLKVMGTGSAIYVLPFACVRKGADFYTYDGHKLEVKPLEWRSLFPRTIRVNPRNRAHPFQRADAQ